MPISSAWTTNEGGRYHYGHWRCANCGREGTTIGHKTLEDALEAANDALRSHLYNSHVGATSEAQ